MKFCSGSIFADIIFADIIFADIIFADIIFADIIICNMFLIQTISAVFLFVTNWSVGSRLR